MPLVRQELDIPLTVGLAQGSRTEPRDSLAGFDQVHNTVQERAGAWTKRPGSTQLAGAAPASIIGLHGHRAEVPVLHEGKSLYVHGASSWALRGDMPWLDVTRTGLVSGGTSGTFAGVPYKGLCSPVMDSAQANGIVGVIYATDKALFAATYDATTKACICTPVQLQALIGVMPYVVNAQVHPTVIAVGTRIIALWRRISWMGGIPEDCLWWSYHDTASPLSGWSAPAQLIGAGVLFVGAYILTLTNNYIRPSACGMATSFVVALRQAAGGGTLLVRRYDSAGNLLASAAPLGATLPGAYHVVGREDRYVWVAGAPIAGANIGGNVDLVALNPTTLATVGAVMANAWPEQKFGGQNEVTQCIGIVTTGEKTCLMVVGNRHENPAPPEMRQGYLGWRRYEVDGGGNVAAVDNTSSAYNLHPYTRPWEQSGKVLVMATPHDTFNNPSTNDQYIRNWQKCLFAVDVSAQRDPYGDVHPVASIAPRICTAFGGYEPELWTHQIPSMPSGGAALVVPIDRSGQADSIELVELDPMTSTSASEVGGLLHISGGVATAFAGVKGEEVAFLETPRVRCEALTAGPGLTGVYYYVAVYEYVDAAGNVHQSAPSAPVTPAAVPANQTVNIVVTTTACNLRENRYSGASRIRIVIYRTLVGGSTYYRLDDYDNADYALATWLRGYMSHADTLSDATLATRQRLYTQPGTAGTSLPRFAPSALRYLTQHGDVIAGIGDNGRRIWFSAPRVDGEGPWFSDLMISEVEDSSPLVALASLDGRLFVFSRTGIHVIDGQGFAENGTGGYSLPQRLPTDAGCIEPRSVCVTPAGVIFQGPGGLSLLTRAGQITSFGGAVQDTLDAYPTITSAALDAANERAVVHCLNSGGTAIALLFDYRTGTWSTSARVDGAYAKAAAAIAGTYHWASSAGAVLKTSAGWLDGSTWYGQTIETGWIKFAGLEGFQRVWRVIIRFRLRSACGLTVRFAFDYSDSYTETKAFTEAELATAATALELGPARQRCAALRIKLEETAPAAAGTGQGFELLGLRIVWAKDGRYGHSTGQRR